MDEIDHAAEAEALLGQLAHWNLNESQHRAAQAHATLAVAAEVRALRLALSGAGGGA